MKERNNTQNGTLNSREQKVISVYVRATGSDVQIVGSDFKVYETGGEPSVVQSVCRNCIGADDHGNTGGHNCREMHINAIQEAGRSGRPYIYQCGLGLVFWTSPIYNDGEFSGALRGSGYLGDTADKSALAEKCNGEISAEKFLERVSAFPSGNEEKIRSLAEMLQMCAESLSSGSQNHHEVLRVRCEQQASLSVLLEDLKAKYPEGSSLPGYPLDKERQLIASLYRGDKKEMEHLLNEVLALLIFSNQKFFRHIQFRVLELAVLLTRAGINSNSNIAAETNARYLKQIQDSKTTEELTSILHNIAEHITGQITSFQGIPHALAMRKAEAFIRENFTRKISLREIAKIAGLSAPYFSTIFKEEMGENLSKYINRLRVEKASKMLLETDIPLSDISSECCFEDQSWFSKIFKTFTGISPGKYRSQGGSIVQEIAEQNFNV